MMLKKTTGKMTLMAWAIIALSACTGSFSDPGVSEILGYDSGSGGSGGTTTINGWQFNVWNDSSNGGTSSITMSRSGSRVSVNGSLTKDAGTDPGKYGATGLGMTPNANMLSQLKNSSSFSFDIVGDGNSYYFEVVTSNIYDYGYYRARFSTSNGVQEKITISSASLTQPDWAAWTSFNANNIVSIQISIHTEVTREGRYSFTVLADSFLDTGSGGGGDDVEYTPPEKTELYGEWKYTSTSGTTQAVITILENYYHTQGSTYYYEITDWTYIDNPTTTGPGSNTNYPSGYRLSVYSRGTYYIYLHKNKKSFVYNTSRTISDNPAIYYKQ